MTKSLIQAIWRREWEVFLTDSSDGCSPSWYSRHRSRHRSRSGSRSRRQLVTFHPPHPQEAGSDGHWCSAHFLLCIQPGMLVHVCCRLEVCFLADSWVQGGSEKKKREKFISKCQGYLSGRAEGSDGVVGWFGWNLLHYKGIGTWDKGSLCVGGVKTSSPCE